LTPLAVGLSAGARRKTPGLRREEVASIADVGLTWYTWLEQGRDIRVSREALERIAHALRLNQSDTDYFFALAEGEPPVASAREAAVDAGIQRVVESIDRTPAFAVDVPWYVVAFNPLADTIFGFDAHPGRFGRNHIWRFFGDPARIALYADSWDALATISVGVIRANYASRIGDPTFEELLDALRTTGPEFARRWDAHYTAPLYPTLPITLAHARLGRLTVHSTRLAFAARPGYTLLVLTPADDRTAAVFGRFTGADGDAGSAPRRAATKRRQR
jgi:transcriptional regulator with XRE-family HTH domain